MFYQEDLVAVITDLDRVIYDNMTVYDITLLDIQKLKMYFYIINYNFMEIGYSGFSKVGWIQENYEVLQYTYYSLDYIDGDFEWIKKFYLYTVCDVTSILYANKH